MTREEQELRGVFKRLDRELPPRLASVMRWLRHPASRWVRIPAGFLLVLGGCLSILPLLGIWMLPLGLLLLAMDVPLLQRPVARLIAWVLNWLDRWNARKKA